MKAPLDEAADLPFNPLRRRTFMLAVFAMGGGLLMIVAYLTRRQLYEHPNPLTKVIYLGVGSLLILLGVRTFAGMMVAQASGWNNGAVKRWYRASLPLPALSYLGILFILLLASMLGRANVSSSNMLMLVFGLMAGPLVVNGSITFWMLKNSTALRQLPLRAMAGEPFAVDLSLQNRGRFFSAWMLAVSDRIKGPAENLQGAVLFTRVGAKETRTAAYQLELARRGRYLLGPLQVSTRFPLGLLERALVLEDRAELIVYPRVGLIRQGRNDDRAMHTDQAHSPQGRTGLFDDDFRGLREFRTGDNPRTIHWRTTARRNELTVREFDQQRRLDLTLLLDLWQPAGTAHDEDQIRIELAVSLVASLALDQSRHTADARLIVAVQGRTSEFWLGHARAGALDSLLEMLALVEADSTAVSQRDLTSWKQACEQSARNTRIILVSPRPDAEVDHLGRRLLAESVQGKAIEALSADPARIGQLLEFPERNSDPVLAS